MNYDIIRVESKMVDIQLTGIFPRSNELIRATWDYEKGKIDKETLENKIEKDTKRIIELQLQTGFRYITDGMLLWQDLFRPFIENIEGISPGPLTRWFNNNTFFRKPIIDNKLSSSRTFLHEYIYVDLLSENGHWKVILPGLFTFVKLSADTYYKNFKNLIMDFSRIIKAEITNLTNRGASFIQFNEPAITWCTLTKEEINLAKEAYRFLIDDVSARTCIHTYFGDATPILSPLLDYPVDYIGVDFYSTTFEEIREISFSKGLLCGCIDSRSSLLEKPSNISSFIEDVNEYMKPQDMVISQNCDLEFLPRNVAEKKVKLLAEVLKMLEGKL